MKIPVLSESHIGFVGRVTGACDAALKREAGFDLKFGFWWWFWMPRLMVQKPVGGGIYLNFTWMCFLVYFVATMKDRSLIPTIRKGSLIPWGLSWFQHDEFLSNLKYGRLLNPRRQLVLMFPLPLYSRRKPDRNYNWRHENEEVFGRLVVRIRFWSDFDLFWQEDENFCSDMINQPPVRGMTPYEYAIEVAAQNLSDQIDKEILQSLAMEASI